MLVMEFVNYALCMVVVIKERQSQPRVALPEEHDSRSSKSLANSKYSLHDLAASNVYKTHLSASIYITIHTHSFCPTLQPSSTLKLR